MCVILHIWDVCSSLVAHLAAVAATQVRIPASCQILYCTYFYLGINTINAKTIKNHTCPPLNLI